MKSREHKNARDRSRRALKKKAKTFKIARKSSGDLVAIQLSIRLKKGVPKKWITRKLLEEMIRDKARASRGEWSQATESVLGAHEGPDPTGIKLSIIRWKNPDRLADEDTGWRYADPDSPSEQADAWGSLRRIIQTAPLSVRLDR